MIPIRIAKEDKMSLVEELQHYVDTEFNEHIGNIAAEGLLDFVLRLAAPYVYNQAIADARNVTAQQLERLDEDLILLEKPLYRGGR